MRALKIIFACVVTFLMIMFMTTTRTMIDRANQTCQDMGTEIQMGMISDMGSIFGTVNSKFMGIDMLLGVHNNAILDLYGRVPRPMRIPQTPKPKHL